MRMSATGGIQTRQAAKKVMGIGKMWKSGDTLQVAYPIFFDDFDQPQILIGATWGHSVNPKELGVKKIFWPTHSEIIDGEPTKPDLAHKFARIARLMILGSYSKKRDLIESSGLGKTEMNKSLRAVDAEFEVDEEGRIGKQPVLGNLKYIVTTEVLAVPMKDESTPDAAKARVVSQDLSDEKIRALNGLLQTAKYAPKPGDKVFWVQYSYGTEGDKKKDGKVPPLGLTAEEQISYKYPEEYKKLLQDIESLPNDSDMLMKRNQAFQKGDEKDLLQAISTYYILHEDDLAGLTAPEDVDRLKKLAGVLKALRLPVKNAVLLEEMAKIVEVPQETISTDAYTKDVAPTIEEFIAKEEIEAAKAESGTSGEDTVDFENLA